MSSLIPLRAALSTFPSSPCFLALPPSSVSSLLPFLVSGLTLEDAVKSCVPVTETEGPSTSPEKPSTRGCSPFRVMKSEEGGIRRSVAFAAARLCQRSVHVPRSGTNGLGELQE